MAEEGIGRRDRIEPLPRPRLAALAADRQARAPVIVLGARQSGLGLSARVLGLCGVDIIAPEASEIGRVHGAILSMFGHDAAGEGAAPLPSGWWADARLRPLRRTLVAELRLRSAAGEMFGFCDRGMVQLLPFWHRALGAAGIAPRLALCLRNPAAIAAAPTSVDADTAAYRWFADMAAILEFAEHYETAVIEYEAWVPDPNVNLDRLARVAGIDVDDQLRRAVAGLVDGLWREPAAPGLARRPQLRALHALARGFVDEPGSRAGLRDLLRQFADFDELQAPLRRRLVASEAAVHAGRAELEASRAEIATRETLLADALFLREEHEATIAQLRAALGEQEDELARSRRLAAEQGVRAAGLERDLARMQAAFGAQEDELARSRGLAAEQEARAAGLDGDLARLQAAFGEQEDELARSRGLAAEQEARAAGLERDLARLHAAFGEQEDELARSRALAAEQGVRAAGLDGDLARLRSAFGEQEDELARSRALAAEQGVRAAGLEGDLARLRSAFGEQEDELARSRALAAEQGVRVAGLEGDLARLRTAVAEIEHDLAGARAASASAREEAAETANRLRLSEVRWQRASARLAESEAELGAAARRLGEREAALRAMVTEAAEARRLADELAARLARPEAALAQRGPEAAPAPPAPAMIAAAGEELLPQPAFAQGSSGELAATSWEPGSEGAGPSIASGRAAAGDAPAAPEADPEIAAELAAQGRELGLPDAADYGDPVERAIAASIDREWYLAANSDVVEAGLDPVIHYAHTGWREGRDPTRWFATRYYLDRNPDVARAGINPFWHYLTAGRREGRPPQRPNRTSHAILEELRSPPASDDNQHHPDSVFQLDAGEMRARLRARLEHRAGIVVSVSHDDYSSNVGGVQLLVADEQQEFNKQGLAYLHLSPAFPRLAIADAGQTPFWIMVVMDGRRLGATTYRDLAEALVLLAGAQPVRLFVLHSFLGHQIDGLIGVQRALGRARNLFYLHDYATLCPSFNLLRNDVAFCGAPEIGSLACRVCVYGEARPSHRHEVERLFAAVAFDVVAPSPYARRLWEPRARLPVRSVQVQPHCAVKATGRKLAAGNGKPRGRLDNPVRAAFVGSPMPHKGWGLFTELVGRCPAPAPYRFFHFGAAPADPITGIGHVPVAVTPANRAAMAGALARHSIDLVLVLSLCPETFSFVSHEALAAGAHLLALAGSGNVADLIRRTGRGVVFGDAPALLEFFTSHAAIRYVRAAIAAGIPAGRLEYTGTAARLDPVT